MFSLHYFEIESQVTGKLMVVQWLNFRFGGPRYVVGISSTFPDYSSPSSVAHIDKSEKVPPKADTDSRFPTVSDSGKMQPPDRNVL